MDTWCFAMGGYTSKLLKRKPPVPGVLYLDTNAWVNLCRRKPGVSRQRVTDELLSRELCLGIGQQTIAEMSDWPGLHEEFTRLISLWPTAIIKTNDDITAEEIAGYPRKGKVTLPSAAVGFGVPEVVEEHPVFRGLRCADAEEGRERQKQDARKMATRLDELRDNFGRGGDGKFSLDRAGEFADLLVFQKLCSRDLKFVKKQAGDGTRVLDTSPFLTLRLFALVVYFKYYNRNRRPKHSDLGDLEHLWPVPYSDTVVLEKDQADLLERIRRRHPDLLSEVRILTLDALREQAS